MGRSAAGRANRMGVTWDARTGMKVRGRDLRTDGEKRGLFTTDPDQFNPQRLVRKPGPDGKSFRPGAPPPHANGGLVVVRYDLDEHMAIRTANNALSLTSGGGTVAYGTSGWGDGTWGAGTWGGSLVFKEWG